MPKTARILELGCGTGRDAVYMESYGYSVERTDGSLGFVTRLQEQGYPARQLNVISDELGGPHDLIYAAATLTHFTEAETRAAIPKVHAALGAGGRFAFSLKEGEGEEWFEAKSLPPRFLRYWREGTVRALLEETGFRDIRIALDEDDAGRNELT